jgi:hypothetical protein
MAADNETADKMVSATQKAWKEERFLVGIIGSG